MSDPLLLAAVEATRMAVARERDACATLADEMADRYEKNATHPGWKEDYRHGAAMRDTALALRALASAIRARGKMSHE